MNSPGTPSSVLAFSSPKHRRASMSRMPMAPVLCGPSPSHRRRNSQSGSAHSATHKIRDILPPFEIVERNDPEPTATPKSSRRSISATLAYFSPKRRVQTPSSLYEPSPSPVQHLSSWGSSHTEPPPSASPARRFSLWGSSHSTLSRTEESPISRKPSSYHHPISMPPLLNSLSPTKSLRRSTVQSSHSEVSLTELESVCSFAEEEEPMPSILPRSEARELVRKIRGTIEVQKNREEELNEHLEEEKELAKARYLHGNETGAILAMKKVNKLSQERVRVTVARDVASDALADIQAAMNIAKTKAIREKGIDKAKSYNVDIGEDIARVLLEIQEILEGSPKVITDKSKLLQQVKAL